MIIEVILIFTRGLLRGILITWLFEFVLKTNNKLREKYYRHHEVLFGYHVHHSTYGLLGLILSIFLFMAGRVEESLFTASFSLGIIFMHTISDKRFVFIEKQKSTK